MSMVEGRRAERMRSFLRARILYNNKSSSTDCIIKNISTTGAKLELSDTMTVPAEFDLEVPARGKIFRARMMWRDAGAVGVALVQNGSADQASESQLERLKSENSKLKATVALLTKRLRDIGQDVSSLP